MRPCSIPDQTTLQQEITASHERCRRMGLDPNTLRNIDQARLTPEQLQDRRHRHQEFLRIAAAQIEELYQFVAGAGFAVTIADEEGYILHMIGDKPTLERLAANHCAPGFRWTERDVGTSVISLSLARQIPVQINDNEHYCKRGYGHTCSASPVFDSHDGMLGVIAMSGDARMVHPHTLGMVITAARAIENQLRSQKASHELKIQNTYMSTLIDSIDMGVLAADRDGRIRQINDQGRRLLAWDEELEGKKLTRVFGREFEVKRLLRTDFALTDRELFIRGPLRTVQLLCTTKPIFDSRRNIRGLLVMFTEINRIRRLVNEMAGSQARFTFEDIIGTSAAIQETKRLAMIAAYGQSTVLLTGETGTGKELFAQAIHNHSDRRERPFLAINCGAIPRELLESELFGYVEGAFTGAAKGGRPGKFELANGGTLLLDEVGDMPTDMQVKLLRVLQTGEVCRIGSHKSIAVDIRIIAATNAQLLDQVSQGHFRNDLFYRLNVLPINIPALRDRPEDITPLAHHVLDRCSRALQKPGLTFAADAIAALHHYSWPGNVRELENVVERAVNLTSTTCIEPAVLGLPGSPSTQPPARPGQTRRLAEVERDTIAQALAETGRNLAQTAKILGISRPTLYAKIKKYQLPGTRRNVNQINM